VEYLQLPISPDNALRLGAAAIFGLAMLGAFVSIPLSYLRATYCRLRKRPAPRDVFTERVRLAGGLAVLLFATVMNNMPVSTAAVFIGGLLIAPERFLLLLAAILRSKGKDAAKIADGIIKMPTSAIQKKLDDEAKDAEDDDEPPTSGPAGGAAPHQPAQKAARRSGDRTANGYYDNVVQAENRVIDLISNQLEPQFRLQPYSEVIEGTESRQYDAVVIDQLTMAIRSAVEIKYRRKATSHSMQALLSNAERHLSAAFFVKLIIVCEEYEPSLRDRLTKLKIEFEKKNPTMGVAFYVFEDNDITPFISDNMSNLWSE
jgi:hypothetical protein